MKDSRINEKLERILNEGKNPSDIVGAIDESIGGITRIKTKGNGRITFFNHNDGYSLKADYKTIKGVTLAAYSRGYDVEAHLGHGFSTKHYMGDFRKESKKYK